MAPNASDDWTRDPSVQSWLASPDPDAHTAEPVRHEQPPVEPVVEPVVDLDRVAATTPAQAYSETVDEAGPDRWGAQSGGPERAWSGQPHTPQPGPAYGADLDGSAFRLPPKRGVRDRVRDAFSRRSVVVASVLVAVAAVVVMAGFAVSGGGGGDEKPAGEGIAIPPASSAVTSPPANADADCPNKTDGPVTTGRDAGGTDSGPGVIKAFDYAYYVDRSGEKARSLVTPTGKTGTAQQIQAGIDRVDPKTLHCLKITDKGAGLYAVELSEIAPRGGETNVFHQLVQTSTDAGRTWIVSIEKDPSITD